MAAPGKLEIREFPTPKLAPGSLLVKMEMSGICGTDKHTFEGRSKQYAGTPAETDTPFPIVPGHENVGIIADAGGEIKDFYGEELKAGDRITWCPDLICGQCWYCRNTFGYPWCEQVKAYGNAFTSDEPPHLTGGWAEYMYLFPGTFTFKVPSDVPPEVAVLTEVFAVSYAVDRAKECYSLANEGFGGGATVVVQGVGPMGLMCLIKSRILGAGDIVAVDKSDYRLEMAQKCGANYALNLGTTSKAERLAFVKDLTNGRGADLVVECAGSPQAFVEGLELARKGGTYIEAGNFVDTGEATLNVNRHITAKNIRLFGVTNHPFTGYGASLKLMQRYRGVFPFEKIVTDRYPLEKAAEGLSHSCKLEAMKVVITPS
jgi:L-iditol 2-dehydrogenase